MFVCLLLVYSYQKTPRLPLYIDDDDDDDDATVTCQNALRSFAW